MNQTTWYLIHIESNPLKQLNAITLNARVQCPFDIFDLFQLLYQQTKHLCQTFNNNNKAKTIWNGIKQHRFICCWQIENIKSFCLTARSYIYRRLFNLFSQFCREKKIFLFCTSSLLSSKKKNKFFIVDNINDGSIDSLKCSYNRNRSWIPDKNCWIVFFIEFFIQSNYFSISWSTSIGGWTLDTPKKKLSTVPNAKPPFILSATFIQRINVFTLSFRVLSTNTETKSFFLTWHNQSHKNSNLI